MKRFTLFTAALLLAASGALAQPPQLEKGNIMLGVTSTASMCGSWGSDMLSLGFIHTKEKTGSQSYDEVKIRNFSLLPKGGYFIMDNLAVGLQAVLAGSSDEHIDYHGTWTETTIAIGPVVRYYYPLEKIYPFAEIESMFGSTIYKSPTSGGTYDVYKYSLIMAGLSLGAAVPIGDKVTFDMTAGYSRIVWKETEFNENDFSEIYVGPTIRMGFTLYL